MIDGVRAFIKDCMTKACALVMTVCLKRDRRESATTMIFARFMFFMNNKDCEPFDLAST